MLPVRALASHRLVPFLVRTNATLSSVNAASSSNTPPPPTTKPVDSSKPATRSAPASKTNNSTASVSTPEKQDVEGSDKVERVGRKRRRIVKRRAPISLANPRKWNPPVKPGSLPVYDEALKLIKEDSISLKKELKGVLARIAGVEKELLGASADAKEGLEKELEELQEKARILEVQSEINLPWARWYATNGMADLSKPVYRHLVEQRWRNHGALDLLMERIHQMHVVPDLLPSLHPSLDLRLSFPEAPPLSTYLRTRTRRKYKPVEPGTYLLPEQTRRPPRLYTSVFHPETRYYTLLLIDADVPDPENQSFTTYLHWMQPNIALSASSCGPLPPVPHTKYIPPHPQRGSPYHRYCIFLLPHVKPNEKLPISPISEAARIGFNLREFCDGYGLDTSNGGGAHMWREVWNETVSDIYKFTLKQAEPHYGLPPQEDPYADIKALKRPTK